MTTPRLLLLRRISITTAGLALAGGVYRYQTDEGTRRSLTFWQKVTPIYLHYRYVEWKTKGASDEVKNVEFNRLHDRYAPVIEAQVLKLRGYYLKNAQFMSVVDFWVPPQYLQFCKRMQNEVPTEMTPREVRAVIEKNLGIAEVEDVFTDFEEIPIGCASIGQVHRAKLRKTGETVAIKVMGQGVEARFRSDIKTIIDFCRLAMPQHVGAMEEIQKQFVTEFDYRGEARNLAEVRGNVLKVFGDKIAMPKPYLEYCTKEVLTMEYLPGPTLIAGVRKAFGEYAASQGTTLEELEAKQVAAMKDPNFKFKDVEAEARRIRYYRIALHAGYAVANVVRGSYNATVGRLIPSARVAYPVKPVELLNLGEIISLIAKVHAHEIMHDGAFSADPHPGNILLLPDGRVGLIDLGQMKRIDRQTRLWFCRLVVALAHEDQVEAVRVMREAGNRSTYNRNDITWKLAVFWFDRNTPDVMGGRNIQEFLDWCEEQDPAKVLNEDLVMPGRVSVLIRGLANAFGLYLSMAKMWEPVARDVLKREGVHYVPKRSFVGDERNL